MRPLAFGLLVGLWCSTPARAQSDRQYECESIKTSPTSSTTTCVVKREYKDCERNALVAYGLSMPRREVEVRGTFSPEDVARAEPLATEFRAVPEEQRSRALLEARAICLSK